MEPDATGVLAGIARRLDPAAERAETIAALDAVFAAGEAVTPDGALRGALLATTIARPIDAAIREVARLWMPWTGKVFDGGAGTGMNRFRRSARPLLRPICREVVDRGDAVDAVPFRMRIAPSVLDPDLKTLKIDCDVEANAGVVRRVLDELVQVEDGLFLGKVLLRVRDRYRRFGYFTLAA